MKRILRRKPSLNFKSWALLLVISTGTIIFSLSPLAPWAHASALSFICSSSAASTSSASCTGEQAGDLLLVMAGQTSGGIVPTLATGFTSITTLTNSGGSGSTRTGMNVGWSTAASSTSGSGTWTSATDVVMMVYRGQGSSPIGASFGTESGSNSGTTVSYNAASLSVADGSSWFAAFAIRNTAEAQMSTAPTGMITRTSIPATPEAAGFDMNGPTSSNWSLTNVTGFSASAKYTSIVLEIKAAPTITVGATGTQASTLTIPSTADYVGGAFNFIRDVGSANVTSIKITETGTVNATANISNLILFYKQQAACSTSIPSGTTQFNSTGGSFAVSGSVETSTVTGTMAVSSVSQVCVYAQLNVGSGAISGNTLGLQIANPSTDVAVSTGSASPGTAVALAGSTTLTPPGPTADQTLRGGEWFSGGGKQPFYWTQ